MIYKYIFPVYSLSIVVAHAGQWQYSMYVACAICIVSGHPMFHLKDGPFKKHKINGN